MQTTGDLLNGKTILPTNAIDADKFVSDRINKKNFDFSILSI